MSDPYGHLFVHFREEPGGERIHFSLSEPGDPLRWRPLAGGRPVLASDLGTRGVRDPVLVRDDAGRFHILATDLHIETDAGDWDTWKRTGSRSLVLWNSDDLVHWSGPRLVEVAPPTAGMAWAPEVVTDPGTGDRIVFWSSRLYPEDDPQHRAASYSRILFARTRDFAAFTPAEVLLDSGHDIIDTAILVDDGVVHRISKAEDGDLGIYHEIGSGLFADDFRMVASRIGADRFAHVEAPILLRDGAAARWYLFLDQYSRSPQGYFALTTDDIGAGAWVPVPDADFHLPPATKHGGLLAIDRDEWERLAAEPFAALD